MKFMLEIELGEAPALSYDEMRQLIDRSFYRFGYVSGAGIMMPATLGATQPIVTRQGDVIGKWEVLEPMEDPIERMYDEAFAEPTAEPDILMCQNCSTEYTADQLDPIDDLQERVAPGETMPWGQCPDPECAAVCYPK